MGYVRHNAIIVTGDSYPEAQKKFLEVYVKAKELFGELVSPVIPSPTNGYQTFMIVPDGSKEGWDVSDEHDVKRHVLADFVDSVAYEDSSNPIQFVDVGFDECYEAKVDRTNKERPDEE